MIRRLAFLSVLAASLAFGQAAQIQQKISQLARGDEKTFKSATDAAQAGYSYAALYRLQDAWSSAAASTYVTAHKDLQEASMADFEHEWTTQGKSLEVREKRFKQARFDQLPAAVRALAESAELQSRAYYQAALLYGREAGIKAGLYYVGLASGYLDYADFCASLHTPKPARFAAHDLQPEIARLEKELLALYDDPAAAKNQPQFNLANSTLKLAADLNRDGLFYGALQSYLDAAILTPTASDGTAASSQEVARLLATPGRDNSIGLMFWQLAQMDTKRAPLILARALPRYFAFTRAALPAAVATSATGVTVTLVRWPYT